MDLGMPAIHTNADVAAQTSGFTLYDGTGGFSLDIRQKRAVSGKSIIGMPEYFLDMETGRGSGSGIGSDSKCFY